MADIAPVRDSMSTSFDFSLGVAFTGVACLAAAEVFASWPSRVEARRRCSLVWDAADERRRLWPLSMSNERLPSMPSFVTPKKKFLG